MRASFEDYTLGETLVSPSRTVTEADIVNFAMITGDWHPIHVDAEHASQSQFGQRIAHGMLTLTLGGSLCMWMGPNEFAPESFIAFVGMDEIRMLEPVLIGDTIRWEGEVIELAEKSKGRGVIRYSCAIKKGSDTTCTTYSQAILVGRNS